MRRPSRDADAEGQGGFGLVEALIAIMVFSVGLIALAGMTMAVGKQSRSATYWTEQSLVAQDLLDSEMRAGYAGLTPGTRDTTVRLDSRAYSARISVADAGVRARQVAVRVSGFEDTDPIVVSTLLHSPRDVPEEYEP